MRLLVGTVGVVVAGVGLGVAAFARRSRLARRSHRARHQSWGWFTAEGAFVRDGGGMLVCSCGKVPVNSKGIVWLTGTHDFGDCTTLNLGVGVDAIDIDGSMLAKASEKLVVCGGEPISWMPSRALLSLPSKCLASVSEVEAIVRALSLLSWHRANRYDGTSGEATSLHAGGRRRRTASGRTLYPRVNPVAIVLVESADGQRCLLGRQRSYPPGMWTCISGFVEHGESVECAAVREVLEETSVVCGSAQLVASQPWPCGRGSECEIMLAVRARAESTDAEMIDVKRTCDGGGELEQARWFDRAQVSSMIECARSRGLAQQSGGTSADQSDISFVPPPFAIAHSMIASWAFNLS